VPREAPGTGRGELPLINNQESTNIRDLTGHFGPANRKHLREDLEDAFNIGANDNLLSINGISKNLRAAPNWRLSWQALFVEKFLTDSL
jgi:hypothetical protein